MIGSPFSKSVPRAGASLFLLLLIVAFAVDGIAAPKPPPGKGHPPKKPVPHGIRVAPPMPMLPTIARIRVDVGSDHVVITHDVTLPRGDWNSGALYLYSAFSWLAPRAVDAYLFPSFPNGDESTAEKLAIERAPHRPGHANALLGPSSMAGAVIAMPDATLRRAFQSANVATLRIRSLVDLPAQDPNGSREIIVRLGAVEGSILALSRIEVASEAKTHPVRAAAQLCGAEADRLPLTVHVEPDFLHRPSRGIAPIYAVRHASDDLCIQLWQDAR